MLSGVCLKDTLKIRGLVFLLAMTVLPAVAVAGPFELIANFGFDPRKFLLVGIFAGSMVFAVFSGGVFLRAAKRARQAAKLSKENGIPMFLVVSALGANAKSSIFYNKTKGEMERDVLAEKIQNTHILQPSIIEGQRNEQRIGEKIGLAVFNLVQPLFFGKLKKYNITEADDIALAMINLANSTSTIQIITYF